MKMLIRVEGNVRLSILNIFAITKYNTRTASIEQRFYNDHFKQWKIFRQ